MNIQRYIVPMLFVLNNNWAVFCFTLLNDALIWRSWEAACKICLTHTQVLTFKIYFCLRHWHVGAARTVLIYKTCLRVLDVYYRVVSAKLHCRFIFKYMVHNASNRLPLLVLHNNRVPNTLVFLTELSICWLVCIESLQKALLIKFLVPAFRFIRSVLHFDGLTIIKDAVHNYV